MTPFNNELDYWSGKVGLCRHSKYANFQLAIDSSRFVEEKNPNGGIFRSIHKNLSLQAKKPPKTKFSTFACFSILRHEILFTISFKFSKKTYGMKIKTFLRNAILSMK